MSVPSAATNKIPKTNQGCQGRDQGQNQVGPSLARPSEITLECLSIPDAIYWPFERLPDSKLEAYAGACLETALKSSAEAGDIYTKIVLSCELPGCQKFIEDLAQCKQNHRAWLRNRAEAVVRNEPPPDYPNEWVEVKHRDNADFYELNKYVADLIRVGFNRKVDLENQIPKVIPRKSPYVVRAIFSYSLSDYLKMRPELKGPRVISDTELTEFRWFLNILASNPTTKMSRQVRRQIVRTLRKNDFTLHHYQAIVDGAEKWYKCRINPGSIEAYRDELAKDNKYLERSNIETAIAPYDEATGYPRKWRK